MSTLGSAAPTIVVLLVYHIKKNEDFLGAQGTIHILRKHIFRIFGPPPCTSAYVIYMNGPLPRRIWLLF